MDLLVGGVYAISEEDGQLADMLLWNTLAQACEDGTPACLISMVSGAYSTNHPEQSSRMESCLASGRLVMLEPDGLPGRVEETRRMRHIADDLRHWQADQAKLLIIDGAERLLPASEHKMLNDLCDWTRRQGVATVLLFRQTAAGNDAIAQLLDRARQFAGMARIKSRHGVASWEIFHWFCSSGLIASKSFPLAGNDRYQLQAREDGAMSADEQEPVADEAQVLVQPSAFLSTETAPAGWQMIGDRFEMVLTQASGATASTVILAFTPATDFQHLVHCVFELRKRCGSRLKIVIREVNSRMRYTQETLAVRLGANLVAPAEIGFSRFLSLTSMIQGQVFPHRLPIVFEDALRDATPQDEQGYLMPHEFSRAVTAMLERSRLLQVQNVLLRLPLAYGLLPLDALRYCDIKRAGDLCTADDTSVYLFLYACRESDIDKALDRLFGLPAGDLFSTEDRFLSSVTIRQAMSDFDARNERHGFPDLTADLAATPRQIARSATTAVPSKKGAAAQRYRAPAPAVRRPLPVKGAPVISGVPALSS